MGTSTKRLIKARRSVRARLSDRDSGPGDRYKQEVRPDARARVCATGSPSRARGHRPAGSPVPAYVGEHNASDRFRRSGFRRAQTVSTACVSLRDRGKQKNEKTRRRVNDFWFLFSKNDVLTPAGVSQCRRCVSTTRKTSTRVHDRTIGNNVFVHKKVGVFVSKLKRHERCLFQERRSGRQGATNENCGRLKRFLTSFVSS